MGTIVKDGDAYVLKAGNEKYLLDSRKKAKNYKGKDVKITLTFSCPFLEDDLQRCTLASQIGSQISISQSMNFIFWPHFSGMHEGAPPDRPQKPSANVAS
jgi:hypothetical protein